MSLQDGMSVVQVQRMRLDGGSSIGGRLSGLKFYGAGNPYRLCEVGDHVEIGGKWAVVRRIAQGGTRMNVEFLGKRDDPGKQDFPEWDAMKRFEALAHEKVEAGWAVKSTRNT